MLRTRPDMIRTIKCLGLMKPYMNLALGFGMPMSVIVEYSTRREQIVITKCASAASDDTATPAVYLHIIGSIHYTHLQPYCGVCTDWRVMLQATT